MKKLCIVSILVILSIVSIVGTVYAASADITMQPSVSECKKDDEITVEVKISNIDHDKGIIALGGTIEYNKDELEFKGISNVGSWSTSYNSDNGMFAADRSDRTKDPETIFNITFKAKAEEKNDVKITLTGLEASGGDGAINIPNASTSINIKSAGAKPVNNTVTPVNNTVAPANNTANPTNNTVTPANNTVKPTNNTANDGNKTTNNNTSTNTNTNTKNSVGGTISLDKNTENKANSSIPKAGTKISTTILMGLIFLAIAGSLSIYLKFSKLDK